MECNIFFYGKQNLNYFGEPIEARRNHGATIIYDKYMLVYGGINGCGIYLNNICVLNLGNFE